MDSLWGFKKFFSFWCMSIFIVKFWWAFYSFTTSFCSMICTKQTNLMNQWKLYFNEKKSWNYLDWNVIRILIRIIIWPIVSLWKKCELTNKVDKPVSTNKTIEAVVNLAEFWDSKYPIRGIAIIMIIAMTPITALDTLPMHL